MRLQKGFQLIVHSAFRALFANVLKLQTSNVRSYTIERVFNFQFVLNCVWTDDFMLKCQQAQKGNFQIREICGQNLVENKSFLLSL